MGIQKNVQHGKIEIAKKRPSVGLGFLKLIVHIFSLPKYPVIPDGKSFWLSVAGTSHCTRLRSFLAGGNTLKGSQGMLWQRIELWKKDYPALLL